MSLSVIDPYRFAAATDNPVDMVGWDHAYWVEGDAFVALGLIDGNNVTDWPDEVGTLDLSDPTPAAAGPKYRSAHSSFNSQPCVDFIAGYGLLKGTTGGSSSQPLSVVAISRMNTTGTNDFVVDGVDAASRIGFIERGTNGWDLFAGNTVRYDPGTSDTNIHLWAGYVNGASSALEFDGTVTSGNAGSNVFKGLCIGGGYDDISFKLNGEVSFVGVYLGGDVRSDGGWADFENWVETTYGITVA